MKGVLPGGRAARIIHPPVHAEPLVINSTPLVPSGPAGVDQERHDVKTTSQVADGSVWSRGSDTGLARTQEVQVKKMERSMEYFRGAKDSHNSWSTYLRFFNRDADSRGLNNVSKAHVLCRKLRDDAETAIEDLTSVEIKDYDVLVQALNTYFNPQPRREMHREALMGRKQGSGETHADFAAAIRKLALNAFPEEGEAVRMKRNRVALDVFLRGLGNGLLKVYVREKRPTKLADAITWAEQWMTLTGTEGTEVVAAVSADVRIAQPGAAPRTSVGPSATEKKDRQRSNRADRRAKATRSQESVYDMVKQLLEMERTRNRGRYTPKPTSDIIWWHCNKQGHVKRDCDKLKRFVASEGQILTTTECACPCAHEWLVKDVPLNQ